MTVLIVGLQFVSERSRIALRDRCCARPTVEIRIRIEIRWTLSHTVVVVKIGAHTFGAVCSDDGTSGTNRRTGTAGHKIRHEVGAVDAFCQTGCSVVERKRY